MRPAPVWLRPASALALALAFAGPVAGQAPPAESAPLARYVPKDDLAFLVEFDGIDAHADAWRKTAASRILNDTPAGEMISSVLGQWITGALRVDGNRTVGLAKHALRAGFVVAMNGKPGDPKPSSTVVVLRQAFSNRDVKPMAAQLLNAANAPDTKPAGVTAAGHKVYRGKTRGGETFSWWVEESKKEDIVFVLPTPEAAEAVIETLEGKRPNAVDLPARAELRNTADGFEPIGFAWLDPARFDNGPKANAALGGVKQIDVRWGVQGDALQTVARVALPGPRSGALGLLDGASFDRATFPPIPDAATGFGVMALDLKAAFDQVSALADALPPPLSGPIRSTLDMLQKGKAKFRDDLLGHMGPKMAFYALPAKPGDSLPQSPATAILGLMGVNTAIRGAAIFEIDDPVKFGRALDELMIVVNREIKASFAAAPAPPDEPNAPARDRRGPAPAPEFRLSPSQPKSYIFAVPPELTRTFPPSFRPSVRVGPKHVVVATTADVAREALEPKGLWSAPAELADAFANLPGQLKWLQLGDNRDAIAATLATFPAKVQILANSPLLRGPAGAVAATPAAPTGSGSGSSSSSSSSSGSESSGRKGLSMPGGSPTGPTPPPGIAAAEGAPAAGAGAGGGGGAKAAPIVIQVPAAKLPGADTVKGMMFPSLFYVVSGPEDIRVVSRVAFPDISGLAIAPAATLIGAPGGPGMPGASPMPPGGPGMPGGPGGPGMPGRPTMPGSSGRTLTPGGPSSSSSGDSASGPR